MPICYKYENLPKIMYNYKAGIIDCHTYVDKILLSAGEPVSQIRRFTKEDNFLGRGLDTVIQFFSPLPEKLNCCRENESLQNSPKI